MSRIGHLLNEGLANGHAGGTKRETVQRGFFPMEQSVHESPEGTYLDQWIADRVGGGQELVVIGEQIATRLYAGGTIGLEQLKELGLGKKDVTRKLKQFIKDSDGKTRLLENYEAQDGDWQYSYRIMERLETIPLTVGIEAINFKGNLVFVHGFLHSPVE